MTPWQRSERKRVGHPSGALFPFQSSRGIDYGGMEGDLIGLSALLVGLELILGVDNILVIAILVSRLPESKRNSTRIIGLAVALLARIVMVVAGLKLLELTFPAWTDGPDWFRYS